MSIRTCFIFQVRPRSATLQRKYAPSPPSPPPPPRFVLFSWSWGLRIYHYIISMHAWGMSNRPDCILLYLLGYCCSAVGTAAVLVFLEVRLCTTYHIRVRFVCQVYDTGTRVLTAVTTTCTYVPIQTTMGNAFG